MVVRKLCIGALCLIIPLGGCSLSEPQAVASTSSTPHVEQEREARAALERLYSQTPGARHLGNQAAGILVFPEMTKAGFVFGGQYGNGVLFRSGRVAGYYNSSALSAGLQAGAQQFSYALFFMKQADLRYLESSNGWEVGVGPSITVVDQGFANSLSTTTAREGVYAFFFGQKGLMAGLGIQGTKITKTG
jgi:lipid-binding SYLF domain-containing protein